MTTESSFLLKLMLGVRSELVDLTRISCLDGKKARHFYDSGLHSVSELVNSNIQHISFLLQTFLPFERFVCYSIYMSRQISR